VRLGWFKRAASFRQDWKQLWVQSSPGRPNGKRYARKDGAGDIEFAFGFDLSPLVSRSEEFETVAAVIAADARAH